MSELKCRSYKDTEKNVMCFGYCFHEMFLSIKVVDMDRAETLSRETFILDFISFINRQFCEVILIEADRGSEGY